MRVNATYAGTNARFVRAIRDVDAHARVGGHSGYDSRLFRHSIAKEPAGAATIAQSNGPDHLPNI
jgi:hypothetical protein